jgi:N-succinyldiaminopimelate aminotransferase
MKMHRPAAGFYLWPETPVDDVEFTRRLMAEHNLQVLPGSFNARTVKGVNPGARRIRIALVATLAECMEAANRIKLLLNTL